MVLQGRRHLRGKGHHGQQPDDQLPSLSSAAHPCARRERYYPPGGLIRRDGQRQHRVRRPHQSPIRTDYIKLPFEAGHPRSTGGLPRPPERPGKETGFVRLEFAEIHGFSPDTFLGNLTSALRHRMGVEAYEGLRRDFASARRVPLPIRGHSPGAAGPGGLRRRHGLSGRSTTY